MLDQGKMKPTAGKKVSTRRAMRSLVPHMEYAIRLRVRLNTPKAFSALRLSSSSLASQSKLGMLTPQAEHSALMFHKCNFLPQLGQVDAIVYILSAPWRWFSYQ